MSFAVVVHPRTLTLLRSVSMSIYPFKPTFLYIKRHKVTGLLYFGKTTKDPISYNGSGVHWIRHCKKHGEDQIETLWYCLFTEPETLTDFALSFSIQEDIVNSKSWANMLLETGLDGMGSPGRIVSESTKEKISKANSGKKFSAEINAKKGRKGEKNGMFGVRRFGESSPHYGHKHSDEAKAKISEKAKNRPRLTCPHCQKECVVSNAKRHHFDNCSLNPNLDKEQYLIRKMSGRVCRLSDRKEMDAGNWAIYLRKVSNHSI